MAVGTQVNTAAPQYAANVTTAAGVPLNSGGVAGGPKSSAPAAYNAGAKMPTPGAPGGYVTAGANGLMPAGTMTANISNPASTATSPAPAVTTSTAAANDLANKVNQVNTLNNDTANQASTIAASQTPPPASSTGTSDGTSDGTSTPAGAGSSTGGTGSGGSSLDNEVNDLLSSFDTTAGQEQSSAQAEEDQLGQEAQDTQSALDQGYTNTMANLNAIQSGSFPLTPAESSLLTSTTAQYQQTIQFQQMANTSYVGQMKEALARTGAYTSGSQASSLIEAAITQGTMAVTNINSNMGIALANMQIAFQTQDYNQVQQSWSDMSSYMTDRINALTTMQTNVATQSDNLIKEQQAETTAAITAMINTAKFTETQKEDVIKNALAQGTLDEKTANDLRNYSLNEAKFQLSEQTANGGLNGGIPGLTVVSTTTTGQPNTAQQAAMLAQLPPNIASQVKAIANYQINPATYPQRLTTGGTGLTRQQAISLAEQYDPNYDENQYAARTATMKSFESGTYSQNVTALNTAISHLSTLATIKTQLGNVGFTPANVVKNTAESLLGAGSITANQVTMNAAVGEIASAFKKSGATDTEIANLGTIDTNSSPEQIQSYISAATNLLSSRLDALNGTYSSSMGTPPPGGSFLSVANQQTLLGLQKQGYNIQVPSLASSPVVQLQSFYDASKANSSMIDQLMQQDPSLQQDPQQTIDLLAANGIQI